MWKSIPVALRKLNREKPKRLTELGFDTKDSEFTKLLEINTKTEFAEKFKVTIQQLNRWDRSKVVQKITDEINSKSNVLRFRKDIDFNFTMMTMRESDASRVKLWKQLYQGFKEEQVQESPAMEKLANAIKKLAERK